MYVKFWKSSCQNTILFEQTLVIPTSFLLGFHRSTLYIINAKAFFFLSVFFGGVGGIRMATVTILSCICQKKKELSQRGTAPRRSAYSHHSLHWWLSRFSARLLVHWDLKYCRRDVKQQNFKIHCLTTSYLGPNEYRNKERKLWSYYLLGMWILIMTKKVRSPSSMMQLKFKMRQLFLGFSKEMAFYYEGHYGKQS